jgi:hypothetical protein
MARASPLTHHQAARSQDRVSVALRESRSSRSPLRVAGLTWSPGPQIPETRLLRHHFEITIISVPSLLLPQPHRFVVNLGAFGRPLGLPD